MTSNNRKDGELQSMDSLSATLRMAGSEVERSRKLNTWANKLAKKKLVKDVDNIFYALDTTITREKTELKIPHYYAENPATRIPKGIFDPRFTLATYYNYLLQNTRPIKNIELPFHWSDWVDFSVLDHFVYQNESSGDLNCKYFDVIKCRNSSYTINEKTSDIPKGMVLSKEFCHGLADKSIFGLNFVVDKFGGGMTQEKAILAGKAYLYTLAPNPESILFLTKDGLYQVRVGRKQEPLIAGNAASELLAHGAKKHETINTLDTFKKLQKERPVQKDLVCTDYEIFLQHSDFLFDPTELLLKLHFKENERMLTRQEINYRNALLSSLASEEDHPKYFIEAKVFDKPSDHYDWRFFNGIEYRSEHSALRLHRLIRTWLSFTRKQGLKTWVAHGSLLAWHFNGMNFPWDEDVDVQMPIQDFLILSENFNQSLIVEDAEDGFGRYFLDCSTFVTARTHGNGNNNIDARFIDVDTGLYVDITALAVSAEKPSGRFKHMIPSAIQILFVKPEDINGAMKFYNCRNHHFVSLAEISPLVRTFFNGELAYVPKNYPEILKDEYGDGFTRRHHADRIYLVQLRIWVHKQILMVFLRHPEQWKEYFSNEGNLVSSVLPEVRGDITKSELDRLQNLSEEDLLLLLHHDEIFLRYQKTREVTMFHEAEGMRLQDGKSTAAMVQQVPDLPPLLYEPFLYTMRQEFQAFEQKVERHEKFALRSRKAIEAKNSKPRADGPLDNQS